VAVVIITFLIWKFCLKGKRQQYQEEEWNEVPQEKDPNDFMMNKSARASTHTVASLASTIMTRASNVIQIAYIPGVTNRSGPGSSPGLLVPPVPPIPAMASPSTQPSSPYSIEDQHFFVPGDLRDSTYSGTTSHDGHSSYARTSITPSLARSSVATTMYRQNAIVPAIPAQTIVRGKAAVVSVKSSQTNSPVESPYATPPVPQVDYARFAEASNTRGPIQIRMPTSSDTPGIRPSPAGSVRSTATVGKPVPLNIVKRSPSNASTSGTAPSSSSNLNPSNSLHSKYSTATSASPKPMRPLTEVSITSSDSSTPSRSTRKSHISSAAADSDSDSESDPHERVRRSLLRAENTPNSNLPRQSTMSGVTSIADTPAIGTSPFADIANVAGSRETRDSRTMDMDIMMMEPVEERRRSVSRDGARGTSPFGDENEVRDEVMNRRDLRGGANGTAP